MTKKIVILGTGGNCIDILDTLNEINAFRQEAIYKCAGFLDDDERKWGKKFHGVPVLGPLTSATQYTDCAFINGIGSESNFWRKQEIISKTGIDLERFESIIHPTASVSKMSRIGYGTVVFQNVTIASGARIGNHVIILPNTVISHDDVIGDYTCIAGGVSVSGNVVIGHSCYLGTNSVIISNVRVEEHSLVGMGSVVLRDVPKNNVVVGNPAKFLRKVIDEERTG